MTYFLTTIILLNIMPGPAMFYVAHQTLNSNFRSIVLSIIGIEFGTLLHIVASAIGLTISISKLPLFCEVSKFLSAIFLIYLGVSQLRNLSLDKLKIGTLINPNKSDFDTFIKGAILNVLNPKVLFFFMALLPQFLNSSPNKTNIQIIYMGLIFGLFGGIANVILSFLLKTTITKINDQSLVISIIYYSTLIISGLFILFGLSLIIMTANGS